MFVNIKNTSQYLIYLECIADLMDKNTLNEKDKELLDILKKEVKKLQEDYKQAIKTGVFPNTDFIVFETDLNIKIDNIYLDRLYKILLDIQQEYNVTIFTNKRLRELHLEAVFKTHHLYQN